MSPRDWLAFLPQYARLFEDKLYEINPQVGLKDVEIEFAVAGFSDVLHHVAYGLLRGFTPPPSPLPASQEGESHCEPPINFQSSCMGRRNRAEDPLTPCPLANAA